MGTLAFRRAAFRLALLSLALFGFAVSGGTSAAAAPELSVDKTFGKVSGWSIGYSDSAKGCLAAATFQDGTTIWLGFGGGESSAYLALTNANWRSLEAGKTYSLKLRTRGRGAWEGNFVGIDRSSERGLYASGLKESFVIDLARSGGVSVAFDKREIAALSLSGSADAIKAVLGCQAEFVVARGKGSAPSPGQDKGQSKGSKTGTGFFVSEAGHVMTNHHVIDGCSKIEISQPGALPEAARLVASDASNDLAVLATQSKPASVPPFAIRARVGESVFVYGYPLAGLLATTGNFTIGHVTATAGLNDDTRMVQISAPVQPGNSGGPLVDQYGNVSGVIVSKLNVMHLANLSGDIAQNVNFAIKTSIAVGFLEANGVSPQLDERKTEPLDGASIAERAREFTVKISCD